MWRTGLVAPQHVGSSQTRARTHVPCTGRWILNHCAIREVPHCQRLVVVFYLLNFCYMFRTILCRHYFQWLYNDPCNIWVYLYVFYIFFILFFEYVKDSWFIMQKVLKDTQGKKIFLYSQPPSCKTTLRASCLAPFRGELCTDIQIF